MQPPASSIISPKINTECTLESLFFNAIDKTALYNSYKFSRLRGPPHRGMGGIVLFGVDSILQILYPI